jgi:hypothetical protein
VGKSHPSLYSAQSDAECFAETFANAARAMWIDGCAVIAYNLVRVAHQHKVDPVHLPMQVNFSSLSHSYDASYSGVHAPLKGNGSSGTATQHTGASQLLKPEEHADSGNPLSWALTPIQETIGGLYAWAAKAIANHGGDTSHPSPTRHRPSFDQVFDNVIPADKLSVAQKNAENALVTISVKNLLAPMETVLLPSDAMPSNQRSGRVAQLKTDTQVVHAYPVAVENKTRPNRQSTNGAFAMQAHQFDVQGHPIRVLVPHADEIKRIAPVDRFDAPALGHVESVLRRMPDTALPHIHELAIFPGEFRYSKKTDNSTVGVAGLYSRHLDRIDLYSDSTRAGMNPMDKHRSTIAHEIGHALDYHLHAESTRMKPVLISESRSFQSALEHDSAILPIVGKGYPSEYASEGKAHKEFFAETFGLYWASKGTAHEETFRATMPNLYAWFDEYVGAVPETPSAS